MDISKLKQIDVALYYSNKVVINCNKPSFQSFNNNLENKLNLENINYQEILSQKCKELLA